MPDTAVVALKRHRLPLSLAALVMLIGIVMFVSILHGPRDSFDQPTWLQAQSIDNDAKCLRGRMSRHLREHVLRTGLTREEVVVLLGAPAEQSPQELVYPLGQCGHPNGPAAMQVHFDSTGRLTDTSVTNFQ